MHYITLLVALATVATTTTNAKPFFWFHPIRDFFCSLICPPPYLSTGCGFCMSYGMMGNGAATRARGYSTSDGTVNAQSSVNIGGSGQKPGMNSSSNVSPGNEASPPAKNHATMMESNSATTPK